MSDLTPLWVAMALAVAGPALALLLSWRMQPFWRRFAVAVLGGPALAALAGACADRIIPSEEAAVTAALLSAILEVPVALWLLLLGRSR